MVAMATISSTKYLLPAIGRMYKPSARFTSSSAFTIPLPQLCAYSLSQYIGCGDGHAYRHDFTPEQIRKRMDTCEASVQEQTEKVGALQTELAETTAMAAELKEQHKRLLSWAELFDAASPEDKKMIASYMIKAVTISRDYRLQVDFSISEAQFLNGMSTM